MRVFFVKTPAIFALSFLTMSAGLGKDGHFIVHYKNNDIDTIFSEIGYSEFGEPLIHTETGIIEAGDTESIQYVNSRQEVISGVPCGGTWYFRVAEGEPVSLYSTHPEKYEARELYFSEDGRTFTPCNRKNLTAFFGGDKEVSAELKKYLRTSSVQKLLMFSNISAAPGLLIGLATPAGWGLVAYGILSTGASVALDKPVLKKLIKVVSAYNRNLRQEDRMQEQRPLSL